MDEHVLATTRRSLHAVAELVIAGPQHRTYGTIRLRVVPGGFAGVASALAVELGDLVWPGGRVATDGRTCGELAAAAGVDAGAPEGLYHDGCGVDVDEPLSVDDAAAGVLAAWYGAGDGALRTLAPGVEPVLWPEHFDLGLTVGEVNYGVSPGDGFHAGPYAYVGPWSLREGPFWNAPFGAFRPADELVDGAGLIAFFGAARSQLS